MKALSLFSGIGGLDLAAHWAGIETVAFCEREPFPQKVLRKHWPDIPIYDDVCTLTKERLEADGIGTIELIHGGYPCQPFSNAGQRRGKEDDRHLWPEVRRLIETIKPRWFVGENVAGHVTLGLDDVLSDLEALGYTAKPFVLPASAVGAPHRRDRVFIVAYSDSIGDNRSDERRIDGDWSEKMQGRQESFSGLGSNSHDVGDSECSGCSGESWRGTESQLEDGYLGMEVWDVGNATGSGLPEWRRPERNKGGTEAGTGLVNESERSSKDVADASSSRQQKRDVTAITDRSGHGSRSINARRSIRAIESRMGGVLNGLSARLDGFRWPAGRGQQQYDWEPPRVKTGVKHRVGRLKSLGNAVVPEQVYPIFEAIKEIDAALTH